MIKLYVDWNVMSQMKHGFHQELFTLLSRKNQLCVYYSTSHISDILVSYNGNEEQNLLIESDLLYICTLTANRFICNENKNIVIGERNPVELFYETLKEKALYGNEGPLEVALGMYEPGSTEYNVILERINSPMPQELIDAFANPLTVDRMRAEYPGLEENPSVGNLVKIGWLKNRRLMESDEYATLRKKFQDALGINKDRMFAQPNPFEAIANVTSKLPVVGGFNVETPTYTEHSPQWFQDIVYHYNILDLHGFQQDKIKVDSKNKDTMRNTVDDSFHTAFASICDFYILNDTRSNAKAKQVYQKLNINTRIYTPTEFVSYGNANIVFDDPKWHLNLWFEILKSPHYRESEEEDVLWRKYHLDYFLFDYFNRVYVIWKGEVSTPSILLSKEKPTNYKFTSSEEVDVLIEKLNTAFESLPIEAPITLGQEINYHWNWTDFTFNLVIHQGFLQLYLGTNDPIKENEHS